jgi:hypothetical protein
MTTLSDDPVSDDPVSDDPVTLWLFHFPLLVPAVSGRLSVHNHRLSAALFEIPTRVLPPLNAARPLIYAALLAPSTQPQSLGW